MKFAACKYNFFSTSLPASKYDRKENTEKLEIFSFTVFFLTRMGVAGCLQEDQMAADRSLTIVMSQNKGTQGFRLALFIVCSNGDCSVNIYLAKNVS